MTKKRKTRKRISPVTSNAGITRGVTAGNPNLLYAVTDDYSLLRARQYRRAHAGQEGQ